MKAHRKLTQGAALIECVQVAAELAGWPLSEEARRASSRVGGGGERARIPPTPPSRTRAPAASGGRFEPGRAGAGEPRRAITPPPAWTGAPPAPTAAPAGEPARPEPERREPPSEPPRPASGHGAIRFSSVFGSRRR